MSSCEDYIPFEGWLRAPRKITPEELERLRAVVEKIKAKRAAALATAKQGGE